MSSAKFETDTRFNRNNGAASPLTVVPDHINIAQDVKLTKEIIDSCKQGLSQLVTQMKVSESSNFTGKYHALDKEFDFLERASGEDRYDPSFGKNHAATQKFNLHKNRYVDVLPFDHSRVILKGLSKKSFDGSDYINANIISNPMDEIPSYIATQGPLDSTVVDFWDMVTQHNCTVIIMLTREVEGNRVKCGHYFPHELENFENFGNFRVTNTQTLRLTQSVLQRTLLVENSNPQFTARHVKHFQFIDWPDHGVPSSTSSLRFLIRLLRDSAELHRPHVIHCSAGIGRTGTYCTIDFCLKKILNGNASSFSIFNTVRNLRQQREGMVQTKEQYRFCYSAVRDELEYLIDSHT